MKKVPGLCEHRPGLFVCRDEDINRSYQKHYNKTNAKYLHNELPQNISQQKAFSVSV